MVVGAVAGAGVPVVVGGVASTAVDAVAAFAGLVLVDDEMAGAVRVGEDPGTHLHPPWRPAGVGSRVAVGRAVAATAVGLLVAGADTLGVVGAGGVTPAVVAATVAFGGAVGVDDQVPVAGWLLSAFRAGGGGPP
jgi:hypothetical protein